MEKMKRGDKIYLDEDKTQESFVNNYIDCRDGVVEVCEYRDSSGYGSKVRLFLCNNTKHEHISIIRQTFNSFDKNWNEEILEFDSDSFVYLEALLNNQWPQLGGEYSLVRDY